MISNKIIKMANADLDFQLGQLRRINKIRALYSQLPSYESQARVELKEIEKNVSQKIRIQEMKDKYKYWKN